MGKESTIRIILPILQFDSSRRYENVTAGSLRHKRSNASREANNAASSQNEGVGSCENQVAR